MADQSGPSGKTGRSDANHLADLLAESSLNDQNTHDSAESSTNEQNTHYSEMMVDETELPQPGPAVVHVSRAYMDMVDRTLAMAPQGATLRAADVIDMIDRASAMTDPALPVLRASDSSPESSPEPAAVAMEGVTPQGSQTTGPVINNQGTFILDPNATLGEVLEYIVTAITSDKTPIEDIRRNLAQEHGIHIDREVMVEIVRGIRSLVESALFSNRPDLPTNGVVLIIEAVQNLPRAWQQMFDHFWQLLPNLQGNGSLIEAWAIVDLAVQEFIRTSTTSTEDAA